jgi:hypothetical protein
MLGVLYFLFFSFDVISLIHRVDTLMTRGKAPESWENVKSTGTVSGEAVAAKPAEQTKPSEPAKPVEPVKQEPNKSGPPKYTRTFKNIDIINYTNMDPDEYSIGGTYTDENGRVTLGSVRDRWFPFPDIKMGQPFSFQSSEFRRSLEAKPTYIFDDGFATLYKRKETYISNIGDLKPSAIYYTFEGQYVVGNKPVPLPESDKILSLVLITFSWLNNRPISEFPPQEILKALIEIYGTPIKGFWDRDDGVSITPADFNAWFAEKNSETASLGIMFSLTDLKNNRLTLLYKAPY